MNTNQVEKLKKIMDMVDADYQLSQLLYDRHVELDSSIKSYRMQEPFYDLCSKGVRREVLEELMMSKDFEDLLSAFQRELTGVIAKWDLADQLDTARNAA